MSESFMSRLQRLHREKGIQWNDIRKLTMEEAKNYMDIIEFGKSKRYMDTDNVTPYSEMIINRAKQKINSAYGIGGCHMNNIDKKKLKAKMFKLEVTKLMLQYDLSISHEDTHGAFKIIPYNQDCVDWFNESEYNE